MRIHNTTKLLQALFTATIFVSCMDPSVLAHQFEPVSNNGWHTKDTVVIPLPKISKNTEALLSVEVRTTNQYEYSNMILEVEQCLEHPAYSHKDTVQINMANEKGRIDGEGVNLMTFEHAVQKMVLTEGQKGEIRIRQIMSQSPTLHEVKDVGLMLQTISTGIEAEENK